MTLRFVTWYTVDGNMIYVKKKKKSIKTTNKTQCCWSHHTAGFVKIYQFRYVMRTKRFTLIKNWFSIYELYFSLAAVSVLRGRVYPSRLYWIFFSRKMIKICNYYYYYYVHHSNNNYPKCIAENMIIRWDSFEKLLIIPEFHQDSPWMLLLLLLVDR